MKTNLYPLLALLLLLSSCGNNDDDSASDNCGSINTWSGSNLDFTTYDYNGVDDWRDIYFEDISSPYDVCPGEQVHAYFSVVPVSTGPVAEILSIKGKLYWGQSNELYISMPYDAASNSYKGELTADLSSFFGDNPAWFGATIIYSITYNPNNPADSLQASLQIIDNKVYSMNTSVQYYQN